MQSVSTKYPNTDAAKTLLSTDGLVPLTVLVACCDALTKGGCFAWELDTTLEELEDLGCLPNELARDRLLGGIAALANPAYLWDSSVFMTLAQTINGSLAVPHIWEPLSPAQVAYAVNELNYLNKIYNNATGIEPLFGEEPLIYMAGCLHDSGIPHCPSSLSLCSEQLERFYELPNDLANVVANPVLSRKLEEVSSYIDAMSNLRAKNMDLLSKKLKDAPTP